ncbi:proton-conducting transporter transmembrane domain-containing protein [Elioraea rosea]|uniref:proton-conducting transporter transmembrane domain-containing protein n=1 Tax=Elioraea rosea TaxID=2492390 RepID=UPI001184525D|nr:proton-conducting transporter membrane subunit [Elioraea rosea]
MPTHFLPLLAPLALAAAAFVAFRGRGLRPTASLRAAGLAALAAVAVAAASLLVLLLAGPGGAPLALVRLDAVSVAMLLLVSFVGCVVVRFSATYLDGEARQGEFTGWLCLTLAAALLLVQAGSLVVLVLAWVAAGFGLQRLLLFYAHRTAARRAARKKAIFARTGDVMLAAAALLLGFAFGTADIGTILETARAGEAQVAAVGAAALLAFAALLKSAQFPVHGWLTEVMETPTPVSALLHAGLINAGGFLLIRFADVLLAAPGVLAALAMIGGFTALFAGLVMLTQPAVKTALAWSTIAQMGFMILQCGLALFPLALLHIIAHSLYKAHAFLAAGRAVATVAAIPRPGPVAVPSVRAVGRAFLAALALYGLIGAAFSFDGKSPAAIALGAILVLGVAYLLAQGFADAAPGPLTLRTSAAAAVAATGYFALQRAAEALTAGVLPPPPEPDALEWVLIVLAVLSFALAAFAQATFPLWAQHPAAAGLRVHLANGLYVNALTDRFLNGWSTRNAACGG